MNSAGIDVTKTLREFITSINEIISNIHGQIGAVMLVIIGITLALLAVKVINGNIK